MSKFRILFSILLSFICATPYLWLLIRIMEKDYDNIMMPAIFSFPCGLLLALCLYLMFHFAE